MTVSAVSERVARDTFTVYLSMWTDALETGQAMSSGRIALPATVRTYRLAAEQLGAFLREKGMPADPTRLTREHVGEWIRHLRADVSDGGQGLTEQTVLQRFRSVSRLFAWLLEEGEITESPMAKMKPPRPPEKLVPVVRHDDLVRLFKATAGPGFEERRDKAIISLFIDCGLRVSEMAGIQIDDVDFDEREITIRGKGNRPRTVRFVKETRQDLQRYLLRRGGHPHFEDSALWIGKRGPMTSNGVYQMVQRRCERAGIDPIHPHMFRHTFAHEYLRAGGNEGDLMRITGWKSRQMVDRYGASAAASRAIERHDEFSPRRAL
ncbi:MAG: tyrosine-type recombinase/integrase [Dehalococcoidia bacterium]